MSDLGESAERGHDADSSAPVGLVTGRPVNAAPVLDQAQQRVVAHRHGPMLVLAGPGTGKTTTIVEAVVARLQQDQPLDPEQIAVLTFGRAAAAELRDRISARLQVGQLPSVATFHSFAWGLLREFQDPELVPQHLLSGPEQDLMIRELLADPQASWAQHWPAATRDVLDSPALAEELASFISAVRAHGWDSSDVLTAARAAAEVPGSAPIPREWPAAAEFFQHYLTILDMREAVDYAEAIHRATLLVRSEPRIAERFRMIYVDEYQDTDPAQVALVQALAAAGASVVAVGDPDQAIYRFRGADVSGILSFQEQFRTDRDEPAPVVVLDQTRRFGSTIRDVAATWINPVSLGALPVAARRNHRSPTCVGPQGVVDLLVSTTPEDQAAAIADTLRRARFDTEHPLRWSDMAVLVRAGVADIPRLQRALLHAGVPVEVPAGETPIGKDPTVAPLLIGLRLAVEPHGVSAQAAETFLRSPLVGLTPIQLRRVQRKLRAQEIIRADAESRLPRSSEQLVLGMLVGDVDHVWMGDRELDDRVKRVLGILRRTRQEGLSIAERLWVLWCDGEHVEGDWAQQLQRRALAGGISGQRADAVLDVVVELFRAAERIPRGAGVGLFLDTLENQEIVAARSEDLGFTRDCVRLLTAHRAKGLQWPMVVVVGLQQDQWPMVRNPATLLQPDRLGAQGVQPGRTRAELVDDERRLAYVAATRAQQRLVLSVIDSDFDGDAPSVLFSEAEQALGVAATVTEGVAARTRLTGASLVADLRTVLDDPTTPPELAEVAASRLALLADDSAHSPIAEQAHPRLWWGTRAQTASVTPLIDGGASLSATVVKQLQECSLKWFLERRMHAGGGRSSAMAIGSLVHAAIKEVIDQHLQADVDVIMKRLAPAWDVLPDSEGWQRDASQRNVREQIERFLRWWESVHWQPLATESSFTLDLPGDQGDQVRGSIDLVARTADGEVMIIDFKTGKSVMTEAEANSDLQLALYQWAYAQTATEGQQEQATRGQHEPLDADEPRSAGSDGAMLVYLKSPSQEPKTRTQPPLTDDTWVLEAFEQGAQTLRAEHIVARRNKHCRTCSLRPHCPLWATLEWLGEPQPPESDSSASSQAGVDKEAL